MKKIISLLLLSPFFLSACDVPKKTESPVTNATSEEIAISNARIRVPSNGMIVTAAYFNVKNNSNEELDLVSATSSFSPKIELHTHNKSDDGMMEMRQIEQVTIPKGQEIILNPGGLHLMVFDINKPIKEGDSIDFEAVFKNGKSIKFNATAVSNPSLTMPEDKKSDGAGHSH